MQNIPRPEHPRPDRFRPLWMNLNGKWQFAFDPGEEGLQSGWMDERPLPDRIIVPFAPESRLSDIHDESLHSVCWYKRMFDLPVAMIGRRVLLHFGAVDHEADVWLNGRHLGKHVGGYSPFFFDVTAFVNPANNHLVMRVLDNPSVAKCRGKQHTGRYPEGCLYMRMSGIWQTVWLEAVGKQFIRDWRIVADPGTGKVNVSLAVDGAGSNLKAEAVVYFAYEQNERISQTAPVQNSAACINLTVPCVRPWTPDVPNLYGMILTLRDTDGAVIDRVETYFGFRRIETRDGRLLLNGKPFFFKAALDQGYYPDSLYTPPTDEQQREDILWAKRFGLNGIRKHQIVPEPRFFYWCDRLGLMVWAEMADWGSRQPRLMDSLLAEWKDCMLRDINHPSIIAWVPTNEWICDDAGKASLQEVIQAKVRAYETTKVLDPTRLALDTSGYSHTRTDICDLHLGFPNAPEVKEWFNRRIADGGENGNIAGMIKNGNMTIGANNKVYCPGYKYGNEPIIISEIGNWGIMEYSPMGRWKMYCAGPVKTTNEFLAIYRDVFTALMDEAACAGFCYVQLYDVEGEVNGYLTYDRKPKIDPALIAALHARRS